MLKRIWEDIGKNTEGMDRDQKLEYIITYYWYHILLVVLGSGILVLFLRHLFFQKPPKEFVCVMVNQAIRYDRDEKLQKEFAQILGTASDAVLVDSDYVFSYEGKRLEGANESSYEKFFFRWSVGELDAVIMPMSFYAHCRELEYEFMDLELLLTEEEIGVWKDRMLSEDGRWKGIYLSGLYITSYLEQEKDDPLLLVFLEGEAHLEAKRAFFRFAVGAETDERNGEEKGAGDEKYKY